MTLKEFINETIRKQFSIQTLLFCTLLISSTSFAETGQLTGDFTLSHKLFNDGNSILYTAGDPSILQQSLYQKEIRGGTDVKLSNVLGSSGRVDTFKISQNEDLVVFSGATSCCFSDNALYSVPIGGGTAATLVSPTLPIRLVAFEITPDNDHVLYLLEDVNDFSRQLYKVPAGGGVSTPLGVPSVDIRLDYITPDSLYMVFAGNVLGNDIYSGNLFRMSLSDGSVVQLNEDFVSGGFVDFPVFSADGQTVIYDAVTTEPELRVDIFSVQISGDDSVKLNPTLVAEGNVSRKFIGPLEQFVYYVADQFVNEQHRLFRVPLEGGDSTELISNFIGGESISQNRIPVVNVDGTYAVFNIDATDSTVPLYSVNLLTGVAQKLNIGVGGFDFSLSGDGEHVVFMDFIETVGVSELYSIPIQGGAVVKLNPDYTSLVNVNSIIDFEISPDSQRVVYKVDIDGDFKNEILEVSIEGGESKRLSPLLPVGSSAGGPMYNDDGTIVLFQIFEFEGVFEGLYAYDFQENVESEICFPVIAKSGNVAVICL